VTALSLFFCVKVHGCNGMKERVHSFHIIIDGIYLERV
jgi:hypothetical protein